VATQRPHLRAKFRGTPEGVASYLLFVAEEARQHLAALGFRSMDEAIGRVECLQQKALANERADSMSLSPLITPPADPSAPRRFVGRVPVQSPRSELGDQLLADAYRGVWEGDDFTLEYAIGNADRTIGAALGGAIALEHGDRAPRGNVTVQLTGAAGQSFGAFLTHGVELHLTGEANDSVGKGMAGGRIIIGATENYAGNPVLAGNTCLYGATGGSVFIAGAVGERFGVRNSGATAVVEGVGDHACEYMTGGTIAVLGSFGLNIGAGMTGGQAFFWDPGAKLVSRLNAALVQAVRPDMEQAEELRWLVERHLELTGSARAAELLEQWAVSAEQFWAVVPTDRVRRIEAEHAGRVGVNA
jgi:glutamate synthase domain-containing protein 3